VSESWKYVRKKVYDRKKVSQSRVKPNSKFFDVLGRAYHKVKSQIRYFVRNSDIEKTEYEHSFEFAVYKKVIRDENGNEIEVFRKEDKQNELRRDSTHYHDGYWEVIESDNTNRMVKSETVMGVKTITKYSSTWHIEKFHLTNKGDTVTKEQYFWNNDKLVRMIQNGLERHYIYGKTLQDTVKVIPSDEGLYFHSGYNNSVGKIPDKDDPMYEYYAKDPYGGEYSSENRKQNRVLKKLNNYQYPVMEVDIPEPKWINPNINLCKKANLMVCPRNDDISGFVKFGKLLLSTDNSSMTTVCVLNTDICGYKIDYDTYVEINGFQILQSVLIFNPQAKDYDRYCRTKQELQDTYDHERIHILNARKYAEKIANAFMPKEIYLLKKDCEFFKKDAEKNIFEKFNIWKRKEAEHKNPESPTPTGRKKGELCEIK
jgi:hypothetical protein